jgi:Holliday junction resolvasome RuvABC endonuclease subunit
MSRRLKSKSTTAAPQPPLEIEDAAEEACPWASYRPTTPIKAKPAPRFEIHKQIAPVRRYFASLAAHQIKHSSGFAKIQENPILLALDISKESTGWVVLHVFTNEVLATGVIAAPKKTVAENALHFRKEIESVWQQYKPPIVAFEQISVATQFSGLKALSANYGIMLSATQDETERPFYLPVNISSAKAVATGHGKAKFTENDKEKQRVADGLKERFGFEHECFDVTDAYAVAQVARGFIHFIQNSPKIPLSYINKHALKFFATNMPHIEGLIATDKAMIKTYERTILGSSMSLLEGASPLKENDWKLYQKTFLQARNVSQFVPTRSKKAGHEDSDDLLLSDEEDGDDTEMFDDL